jgi:chromosome segregation ATPase
LQNAHADDRNALAATIARLEEECARLQDSDCIRAELEGRCKALTERADAAERSVEASRKDSRDAFSKLSSATSTNSALQEEVQMLRARNAELQVRGAVGAVSGCAD